MIAAYAWMLGGELPSQRLRSHTFGLAAASGFLLAWLASFTAPYFINDSSLNWGPKYQCVGQANSDAKREITNAAQETTCPGGALTAEVSTVVA